MEKPQIGIEVLTKFFGALTIKGWVRSSRKPKDIRLALAQGTGGRYFRSDYSHLGPDFHGFIVQGMMPTTDFPSEVVLAVDGGEQGVFEYDLQEMRATLPGRHACHALSDRFFEAVRARPGFSLLDIGGRARSGVLRKNLYGNAEVTVLDIYPDEGVDVVADAHEMARHLPNEHFDGVISVSVFEHLVMPWQVAVQINQVLKMGGLALIHTHQTIGMHDIPWDYFRFSADAWKGLFNAHTGFKILGVGMGDAMFIQPFVYQDQYRFCERSAGFESSTCLVQKVAATSLTWPLRAADVTQDHYPDVPDGGDLSRPNSGT